jgi:lipooligosaccharide transport system ATP-binding protein
MISARGLTKVFDGDEAVKGIDVDVQPGEFFGFLGPNGAGKSSTMRMIACVSPSSGGELRVLGLDPVADGPEIRSRLGVVPQEDNLDLELSVWDNLIIYGRYFGIARSVLKERAAALLEFVQLTDRASGKVDPLSGGMKRRLTIARALMNDPELILLDEPTTGLDPQARHLVWQRLFQLKMQGVTIVLTTHYMDEAEQLCDRLVIMDEGRIVAEGSPRSLIERYAPREVVELRFPEEHARAAALEVIERHGGRIEALAERILIYTDDGDAHVDRLAADGVTTTSFLVRRSSLEDVFLILTGRTLDE